jgi:hypothetical protein
MARAALERHAGSLGVDASSFRFESVRRSIIGTHVRGREVRGGIPVEGTSAAVHVIDGRVWQVEARPSGLPGAAAPVAIPAGVARTMGLSALGITHPYVTPRIERRLTPYGGRLVDAWHVTALSVHPAVTGTAVVESATGRPLEIRDGRRFADGSATVFDPNPIVTARDASLRQPGVDEGGVDTDLDSPELSAELRTLPLRDLDEGALLQGRLDGPYADVRGPLPFLSANLSINKSDPNFEAAMAYAHIDRIQRYFQSLGFRGAAGVNAEPQDVIAFPIVGFDNSFYQPGNDLMAFGAGGVDDGEDAEVIIHEYGHAVHDAQVPGWGAEHEGGSMGEGWGDFLAGAYYAKTSGGFQDECIMDWDATSYSDDDPPCLRRTDGTKRYPDDMEDEVHADGEIWAAFLWNLRAKLACTKADRGCARWSAKRRANVASDRVLKLVLTSHELMTTTAGFGDGVAALLTAAKALKQPTWIPLVKTSARRYGLPLS